MVYFIYLFIYYNIYNSHNFKHLKINLRMYGTYIALTIFHNIMGTTFSTFAFLI